MKQWTWHAGNFLLLVFCLSTGCKKDTSSDGEVDNPSTSPVAAVITSGTWYVSLFSEKNINQTSLFNGYVFTFQSNGKVLAVKSGVTTNGTWAEDKSTQRLIVNLGPEADSNKPLGELTDDWVITGRSATKISLGDDNSSTNEVVELSKK